MCSSDLVWGGTRWTVPLTGAGEVNVVLPRFVANQRLRADIVYNYPLKAPIRKGDQVAVLRVRAVNEATSEVPLFAAEDVEVAGTLRKGLDSMFHLALGLIK